MRAVLSWTVVVVHVAWVSGIQGATQNNLGVMAVDGFIVLSGFVITQLILIKRESYGTFVFRRAMRLFPLLFVCLLFSLAVRPLTIAVIQSPVQPLLEASENKFFWGHMLAHLSMLHGVIPSRWLPFSQFAFLVPAWSISLEWQLYLVAPLLIWWLARSGLRGMLLVLIPSALCLLPGVYAVIGHIWRGAGAFLPQRFVFFLIGSLIYLFSAQGPRKIILYRYWPFVVRLGEMSYSTYLIHYPVLAVITRFVPRDWPRIGKVPLIFTVGAPVIYGLSVLLYRYVEQPGIELGKRLSRGDGLAGLMGEFYVRGMIAGADVIWFLQKLKIPLNRL